MPKLHKYYYSSEVTLLPAHKVGEPWATIRPLHKFTIAIDAENENHADVIAGNIGQHLKIILTGPL